MTEPGPLLAKGRAADVYEHGDGLVLRRYRTNHDCTYEANVMKHVAAHGYPVPRVADASGRDIVMERIDGVTMLADFAERPWTLFKHTRTLAALIQQLHEIPAPDWLRDKHEGGRTIVHLDLHPDNVMLSPRGPVVIDWTNAGRGDPDTEVADLWLILSCATPPGSLFERLLAAIGRGVVVRRLVGSFDRDAVRRKLALAFAFRSRDRNMSAVEIEKMRRLVAKEGLD